MAAQLFINYKHGSVFSPFYHYGMYSGVMGIQNRYYIFEVVQNGKLLRGQDFAPENWDRIMLPLQYFQSIGQNNNLYQADIKRLLAKMHVDAKEQNFLLTCNACQFEEWYTKYLQHITGQTTTTLSISSRVYHFANGQLNPTDSVTTLAQLCN